jgi:hypothetical protein
MGVFGNQVQVVRGLAAALCVAGLSACASAPPMQSAEIVAQVGEPAEPVAYPAIVLDGVTGPEADVFAEALNKAMTEHGIVPSTSARRLSVTVTRVEDDISDTEARVEMDATFTLAPPDGSSVEPVVYRELAIRTIPGGREAGEIALNNAARAATQVAAAVGSIGAGVAVPSIVTPKVRVPSEYRAVRAAKQDAIAGIIRQFLATLAQR